MNTLILDGQNRYGPGLPGATLEGCIHDLTNYYQWVRANLWTPTEKWNVIVLDNERGTSDATRAALEKAVKDTKSGGQIRYHKSSHGSHFMVGGKFYGVLCCYDSDFNKGLKTFLSADDFTSRLSKVKDGVKIYVTIDACEFGDSIRAPMLSLSTPDRVIVPRFYTPPLAMQFEIDDAQNEGAEHQPLFSDKVLTNITAIAGCKRGAGFTCADVRDSRGAYGAFTKFLFPNAPKGRASSQVAQAEQLELHNNQFEQSPVFSGVDRPFWE